jgi:hypothetical protein
MAEPSRQVAPDGVLAVLATVRSEFEPSIA